MAINALAVEMYLDIYMQSTSRDCTAYVRNLPRGIVDHPSYRPIRIVKREYTHPRRHGAALILK
jgi:hypothetical protein